MGSFYSEHRTWLHGWSASLKMAAVAVLGVGLVAVQRLDAMAAAAVLALALYISLGAAAHGARRMMWGVLLGAALVGVFHALWGQWQVGAVSALRLAAAATLGVALVVTTRMADVVAVLQVVLSPLQRLGLRVDLLALQLGLMLRFVEHFFARWQRLDAAYRLRARGRKGGLRLVAPLAVQMLQAAQRVGDALFVRLR